MAIRAGRLQRPADRLVAKVERREALRPTSLGARGWRYQPREVRYVNPRLQGCPLVPWRLPPLHPLAWVREGLANLGRFAPRECRRLGCLKSMNQKSDAKRLLNLAPLFRGERSARSAG